MDQNRKKERDTLTIADRLRLWYKSLFGKSKEESQLEDEEDEMDRYFREVMVEQARAFDSQLSRLRLHSLPNAHLEPGQSITGRYDSYTIQDPISYTTASRVYKAKSQAQGIDMVVKHYLKEENSKGFARESYSHNALYHSGGHTNIIPAYEFLVTPDNDHLGVFPQVAGETLDKIAAREGPLSLKQVLPLVLPVCDALEHTHNLGLVHRDVKPENIIISASAEVNKRLLETYPNEVRPMIFDYGFGWHENISHLDEPGVVCGTIRYVAPELLESEKQTKSRDIYALGVVLYQLVAGRFPFDGRTNYEVVQAHRFAPTPDITMFNSSATADFKHIVDRTLAKDPNERYQTAGEVKQDLESLK